MTIEFESPPLSTQSSGRRIRPNRGRALSRSSKSPMGSMAFLRLMWLASPALPVGGFSYSEGLEAAFESGRVQTEEDLLCWLQDQLHLSLARGDLAVASKAFVAWQRADGSWLKALNDWVLHTRESSELRLQTEQMGRSLCVWLGHQGLAPEHTTLLESLTPCPTWPVAFALAAFLTQGPQREALLAMGFAWAENMVQAALKTGRLGQIAGQRILGQLSREIPAAVETAIQLPDAHRQAFTPMLAILSARHETQYSRLFRS